jgi:hypothetical protein
MRPEGLLLGAAALCGVGVLATVASCRDPTEVTLVLTTDVPCGMLNETAIILGHGSDVETKQPVTVTSLCDASGTGDHAIGTFVVLPNSTGSGEAFAVRIVAAVQKKTNQDCVKSDGYAGCIIARRELTFVPHTPLTLPIALRLDCEGVGCASGETCVQGTCKSDVVIDPPRCAGGCSEQTLQPVDGGGGSPEAAPPADAPAGATQDAPAADAPLESSALVDATMPDGPSADAPGSGSPPSDAGLLGDCVGNGASSSVACAGGTCPPGQVCCVTDPNGAPVTEACTAPSACKSNVAFPGVYYSSIACRNVGDCVTGTCCLEPASIVGAGYTTTCAASCVNNFSSQRIACRNACECGGLACIPTTCLGVTIATCGGICI